MDQKRVRRFSNPRTGKVRESEIYNVPHVNRTSKEILLAIKDELYEWQKSHLSYYDVLDLLEQAEKLIWTKYPDPKNNKLYMDLNIQLKHLSKYDKLKSERKKQDLIRDVVSETQFVIGWYFDFIDDNI